MSTGKPVSVYLEDDVRRVLDARTPPGSSRSKTLNAIVKRFDELFRASPVLTGHAAEGDVPADRTSRREMAEDIARRYTGMDAGDVEHALSNLLLPPIRRVKRRIGSGKGIGTALKR